MIKVADISNIKIPQISLEKQKIIVKYLNLVMQEVELLKNFISKKQKLSTSIFETLLQGECK